MMGSIRVAKLAGISYRQLDYWVRAGVAPCTQPAKGSGTQMKFTAEDATLIVAIATMHRAGVELDAIVREPSIASCLDRLEEAIATTRAILIEGIPEVAPRRTRAVRVGR